ncbi:MAG: Suppressor of the cold-sensitive snRNP biogenesis mutant brr1-1 [Icmadophila ericetorum]|nr:Suppressor of the cold-sensitive snRNP biogenesis mutant brr1-1 [Icmadophila ericetorum]
MRLLSLFGIQAFAGIAASQSSYFINPPDSNSGSSSTITVQEGTLYTITWETDLQFVALTLWQENDNNFEYPSGNSNMTNTGSYNWIVATSKNLSVPFFFIIYSPGDTAPTISSTTFSIVDGSLSPASTVTAQPTTIIVATTVPIDPSFQPTTQSPTTSPASSSTPVIISSSPSKGSSQGTNTQSSTAAGVSIGSFTTSISTTSTALASQSGTSFKLAQSSTSSANPAQPTTSSSPSSSPPTPSTGLSSSTKLGIGIGFGIGVPIAVAIGAFVGWKMCGRRRQAIDMDELQTTGRAEGHTEVTQQPIFGGVGSAAPRPKKSIPVPSGNGQEHDYYGNSAVAHEFPGSFPNTHEMESPMPSRGGSTNGVSELSATRRSVPH